MSSVQEYAGTRWADLKPYGEILMSSGQDDFHTGPVTMDVYVENAPKTYLVLIPDGTTRWERRQK